MKAKKLTYKQKLDIVLSNPDDVTKQMIALHPSMLNWKNYDRKSIDGMYEDYLNNSKNK